MEEAEALCDRLGIFVDGSLQCIADAKEVVFLSLSFFFHSKDHCHSKFCNKKNARNTMYFPLDVHQHIALFLMLLIGITHLVH